MRLHRIEAVVLRHLYELRHNNNHLINMVYFPVVNIVMWGFLTIYLTNPKGCNRVSSARCSAESYCGDFSTDSNVTWGKDFWKSSGREISSICSARRSAWRNTFPRWYP